MKIKLPSKAEYIIHTLESHGFEAYIVGGCVRDSLLGNIPKDWDVCTSALPREAMACFAGQHIIETGLKHGTITLMLEHEPFEITTYRVDGDYLDNRRPERVEFVDSLQDDLSRRDFTINAMAYHPQRGLIDFFGGERDVKSRRIKCVGDADKRFQEDALRIMRALRFACVLGFSVEAQTMQAMHENRALLQNIAVERIRSELSQLLLGNDFRETLKAHLPILTEIIPEMTPMIGFAQNNPHHKYDVMEHTLRSVDSAPKDIVIRLTMLLHDIAKPRCYAEENGVGHFHGHPKISADMARDILLRLKFDKDTLEKVTELVFHHDTKVFPQRKNLKRWLRKIGEQQLRRLMAVKRADAMAQSSTYRQEKLSAIQEAEHLLDEVIAQQECFRLADLAVNGRDLMAMGIAEGAQIGSILNGLLDQVIDGLLPNDRDTLLQRAGELERDGAQMNL